MAIRPIELFVKSGRSVGRHVLIDRPIGSCNIRHVLVTNAPKSGAMNVQYIIRRKKYYIRIEQDFDRTHNYSGLLIGRDSLLSLFKHCNTPKS